MRWNEKSLDNKDYLDGYAACLVSATLHTTKHCTTNSASLKVIETQYKYACHRPCQSWIPRAPSWRAATASKPRTRPTRGGLPAGQPSPCLTSVWPAWENWVDKQAQKRKTIHHSKVKPTSTRLLIGFQITGQVTKAYLLKLSTQKKTAKNWHHTLFQKVLKTCWSRIKMNSDSHIFRTSFLYSYT